jgi:hypothetical protein
MLNEPLSLVLRTVEQLGGRAVPLARLYAALPGPLHISAIYVDELSMMGHIIVRDGAVWLARVPGIIGGARSG